MRLEIVLWPDPVLLAGTQPVEKVDDRVRQVVAEMRRVMFELRGVGLAAPQVGVPLRLMLVCPSGEPGQEQVLINPQILAADGTQVGEEGCLSFPGIYGDVSRSQTVRLKYRDLDGVTREMDLGGFIARIVQHEADHLDGKVFIDKMDAKSRAEAQPALDELRSRFAARPVV
jgi:peptide deformylase